MAKVFIGMPAYNGERFIREAIESLRRQSYTYWTMLISDDESRDDTQAICEAFARTDSRIAYYRQPKNIGMFPNFRFLFEHRDPNAHYYMQAAHDDVWEPEFIETCIRALEEKRVGVAFTGMATIDGAGHITEIFPNLPALSGPVSARTAYRFVRQPEIHGKANCMYGIYTMPAAQAAWEYAPHRMQWAHDALFSLAAISRYGLAISPAVLFKKRSGGFSDHGPSIVSSADPAYNFVPIGGHRFTHHVKNLRWALQGTGYKNIATLIMLGRGIRPVLRHLRTRNYKRKLRAQVKKILVFFGINIFLWNKIQSLKNIIRYRKIQKKNIDSILEYKRKFDYGIFVETGTYRGNMVEAMKNRFKKIYSIELGHDLYRNAKDRFVNDKHVELLKGDSGIILPKLLMRIKEPAIFWLDAHYSRGDTVKGEIDTPIEQELGAVLNHRIKNHVIMIDDARCFNGENGYPTSEAIEKMALSHGYLFEMKNDNFRLYPKKL